jgi:hypothetical protein
LLKTNPTWQEFRVETRAANKSVPFKTVWKWAAVLSRRMQADAESLWAIRQELFGQAPEYAKTLFGNITFLVDTFPIVIQRASDALWRLATYQGKYKEFIMKVQVSALLMTQLIS